MGRWGDGEMEGWRDGGPKKEKRGRKLGSRETGRGSGIDHAESEITARLRDKLGAAKTATAAWPVANCISGNSSLHAFKPSKHEDPPLFFASEQLGGFPFGVAGSPFGPFSPSEAPLSRRCSASSAASTRSLSDPGSAGPFR